MNISDLSRHPVANLEIKIDYAALSGFLTFTVNIDVETFRSRVILSGKALENDTKYFRRRTFSVFRNGNMHPDIKYHSLPGMTLVVDITEAGNLEGYGMLYGQIVARQRSAANTAAFKQWRISGRIDGSDRMDFVVLRNDGTFCLQSQRTIWEMERTAGVAAA